MLTELHYNNVAKAKEMEQYKMRLQQIGENTTKTVAKVDKMMVTMKSFINVITYVVGNANVGSDTPTKNHLKELTMMLDDDEVQNMDVDNTNNHTKKKSKPSLHRRRFGRRGQPKIVIRNKAGVEGTPAEENQAKKYVNDGFFCNKLKCKGLNLRVVYNNVNGLKIGDFIKSKVKMGM